MERGGSFTRIVAVRAGGTRELKAEPDREMQEQKILRGLGRQQASGWHSAGGWQQEQKKQGPSHKTGQQGTLDPARGSGFRNQTDLLSNPGPAAQ